jgi:hypothetical protein
MAKDSGRDLGALNALLFEELERLTSVDATDKEAVATEVERAKAVQGIASQITQSSKIVLDTVKLRAEWAGSKYASTPRMLNG